MLWLASSLSGSFSIEDMPVNFVAMQLKVLDFICVALKRCSCLNSFLALPSVIVFSVSLCSIRGDVSFIE